MGISPIQRAVVKVTADEDPLMDALKGFLGGFVVLSALSCGGLSLFLLGVVMGASIMAVIDHPELLLNVSRNSPGHQPGTLEEP
jgi:hypothetical protein